MNIRNKIATFAKVGKSWIVWRGLNGNEVLATFSKSSDAVKFVAEFNAKLGV